MTVDNPKEIEDLDHASMRNSRRLRNFLLAPSFQVKMGIISILLASAFGGLLAYLLYHKLSAIYAVVLDLTDAKDEITQLIRNNIQSMWWQFSVLLVGYLTLNIVFSVLITHRMVGPTFAFRRHLRALRDGNFQIRTRLRDGDAFCEVADELNQLSQALEKGRSIGGGSG